jgi:hypothetical protein
MRKLTQFTPPKPITKPFDEGSGDFHQFALIRDDVKFIAELDNGSVIVVQIREERKRGILITPSGGHGRLEDNEVERIVGKELKR